MSRLLLRFKDARQARSASYREALAWAESGTDSAWVNAVEALTEAIPFAETGRESQNVDFASEPITLAESALDFRTYPAIAVSEALVFGEYGFDAGGLVFFERHTEPLGPLRELHQESLAADETPGATFESVEEWFPFYEAHSSLLEYGAVALTESFTVSESLRDVSNIHVEDPMTELINVSDASTILLFAKCFLSESFTVTESVTDVYAHPQQDFQEIRSESFAVYEETLNLFLVATGVTLIEVELDLVNRLETTTSVETFEIVEDGNDFLTLTSGGGVTDDGIDAVQNRVTTQTFSATALASTASLADTVTPDTAHAVRTRMAVNSMAAESVTVTVNLTESLTTTAVNQWVEALSEIVAFGEARNSVHAAAPFAGAEQLQLSVPGIEALLEWIGSGPLGNPLSELRTSVINLPEGARTESYTMTESRVDIYGHTSGLYTADYLEEFLPLGLPLTSIEGHNARLTPDVQVDMTALP